METIKSLEHARSIINNLQRRLDKASHEELVAKARLYDIQNYGKPEPSETDLKAEVLGLRNEIHKLVEQRNHYKQLMLEKGANHEV